MDGVLARTAGNPLVQAAAVARLNQIYSAERPGPAQSVAAISGTRLCDDMDKAARTYGYGPMPCDPSTITADQMMLAVTILGIAWKSNDDLRGEIARLRAEVTAERSERSAQATAAERRHRDDIMRLDFEIGHVESQIPFR